MYIFALKIETKMEKILSLNVKRLCKEQGKQQKDLALEMGIAPASLTRALYGNARLDTIEKIASALHVNIKQLFESTDEDVIEGFIKINGKIHQFSSKEELKRLLNIN